MSIVEYARALWQFARPRTLVVIWLHVAIVYIYLSGEFPGVYYTLLMILASTLGYIYVVGINDISDVEVDKLNLPHQNQAEDRPLINGTISSRRAWAITVGVALLCIVTCALVHPLLSLVGLVLVVLGAIYSMPPIQISKRGALAQYLLPLMYVGFPACIAMAVAQMASLPFLWFVVGLYAIFVGRLFLKDIRDEKGDRVVGKRTYLVRHGLLPTLIHSGVWILVGVGIGTTALYVKTPEAHVFGLVGLCVVLGSFWSLRECYRTEFLEYKLLWVAIIGRLTSMWAFCVLIWLVLSYTVLPHGQKILFVILTMTIFLAGIQMLYEELQSLIRKQAARHRRRV